MIPTVRWGACQRRCRHCRPLERPHSDCCLASLRRVIASHRRSSPLPGFFSIRPLLRSGPPRCLIASARCSCRGRRAGPVRYVEGAAPPVPGRAVAAADGFRAAASTSWCCCCSGTAADPVPLLIRYRCRSRTALGQVLLSFRILPLALRLSAGPGRTGRPAELPAPRVTPVRPTVVPAAPVSALRVRVASRYLPFRCFVRLLLPTSAGPACPAAASLPYLCRVRCVMALRRRSASVPRHRAVRAPGHRTAPHGRPAAVRRGRVP